MNYLSQIQIAPDGGFKGLGTGPLADPVPNNASTVLTNFISSTIGIMTIVAIIWFIFVFFIGAIGIITAGGDKNAVESNKKRITTGITGLVVTLLAILIIRLLGYLLGIDDILNLDMMFFSLIPLVG